MWKSRDYQPDHHSQLKIAVWFSKAFLMSFCGDYFDFSQGWLCWLIAASVILFLKLTLRSPVKEEWSQRNTQNTGGLLSMKTCWQPSNRIFVSHSSACLEEYVMTLLLHQWGMLVAWLWAIQKALGKLLWNKWQPISIIHILVPKLTLTTRIWCYLQQGSSWSISRKY